MIFEILQTLLLAAIAALLWRARSAAAAPAAEDLPAESKPAELPAAPQPQQPQIPPGHTCQTIWEILRRDGEHWVHDGWVVEGKPHWQHVHNTPGLALRKPGCEIVEGAQ